MEDRSQENYEDIAKEMRADCLVMGLAGKGHGIHLGASFSCIEIMVALYFGCKAIDPANMGSGLRDRVILSKGHGVPAQYAAFHKLGLIGRGELLSFKKAGSRLTGHPCSELLPGIEFSSGSLGQGLSLGVGTAIALKKKGNNASRVFVVLGDGECDEGSVWEAAQCAAHYELDNLVAIVDVNALQYDGPTEDVLSLGSLYDKFRAFGWQVVDVDGHVPLDLIKAFSAKIEKAPLAVLARTVKGKGASFAEGVTAWHHGRLTESLYYQAMAELGFEKEEAESRAEL